MIKLTASFNLVIYFSQLVQKANLTSFITHQVALPHE